MAFLFAVPDGATVEAIWRCKRGHESPATIRMGAGTAVTVNAAEMQIVTVDGNVAVCLQCIAEDYRCERVEFGDG